MRTIIIIQTLIIIAGAYYIYTLSQAPVIAPEPEPVVIEEVVTPVPEPVVETEPEPDMSSVSADLTGHSDVGMEFPTMDEDVQLEVR